MKNLIGKRLLDFIIVGGLTFGISCVIWVLDYDVQKREATLTLLERNRDMWWEVSEREFGRGKVSDETFRMATESTVQWAKANRELQIAKKKNKYIHAVSIFVGLLGLISTLGIVFRPDRLSQKDAFIATWKFIPKYVMGYFKSDKKDI
jgi:hypothetical protein